MASVRDPAQPPPAPATARTPGIKSDTAATTKPGLPPDVKPPLSFWRATGEVLGRRLAGIKFAWDEYDAPRIRKYNAGALSDASWLLSLTPGFSATIFARGGLHAQVVVYCGWVSLVYFQSRDRYPWGVPSQEFLAGDDFREGRYLQWNILLQDVKEIVSILFGLLISRFVSMVIATHWTRSRRKRGDVMRNTVAAASLAGTYLAPHLAPGADPAARARAVAFGAQLRRLLRAVPELIIYELEGRPKAEAGALLTSRGLVASRAVWDARVAPLYKHDRPLRLYREAMALVRAANAEEGGPLAAMPETVLTELLKHLTLASGSCSGMLSSVNPQKLPFAYVSLIHWAAKMAMLVYSADIAIDFAEYAVFHGQFAPFTCWGSTGMPAVKGAAGSAAMGCATVPFLVLLATTAFFGYILLGLMDLHAALCNPYRTNRGWVNYGLLKGLETCTRCLVQDDSLSLEEEDGGAADDEAAFSFRTARGDDDAEEEGGGGFDAF